jgi:hypothetical protein
MKAKTWNQKDDEIKTHADYERALDHMELVGNKAFPQNYNH